ncbi:MAG: cupin domain-containing protein [Nannocystaceae bacterium]
MTRTFHDLLAPHSLETFLARFWEREALHVARGDADFYASVLDRADVERLLYSGRRGVLDTRLNLRGRRVNAERYTDAEGSHLPAVYREYHAGASIILNGVQRRHDGVRELGHTIEAALEFPTSVNLYATPPGSQGFDVHFDRHEVFVLQIAGRKRWRIYDRAIECPLHALAEQLEAPAPVGAPTQELVMEPGDLLYLPRGVRHEARTQADERSVHLSIGVLTTTWYDLLVEALAAAAIDDVELRRSLPAGFLSAGPSPALEQGLRDRVERLAAGATYAAAWRRLAAAYEGSCPTFDGHLGRLDALGGLALTSRLRRRQQVFPVAGLDREGHAYIAFAGARVTAPAPVLPALEFAATTAAFAVGELPGLSDEGCLVLARRLITEGLLTPA